MTNNDEDVPVTEPWKPDDAEKVAFRLTRDADGYPPADWEHLWAEELPTGLYRLDNTPFYAQGVSWGDIVSAKMQDDMNVFEKVVEPSGHSTIRVVFLEGPDGRGISALRRDLEQIGCSSELSHLPNLIAIDVPPEVQLNVVRGLLDEGERRGRWEYEEGAIRQ